jgi:hypothetical protein
LFDGFLLHGFLIATDGIREGLRRLVADANLVTNTSATWTYQQPTVVALQRAVQLASNAALGLLIFWMGLNVVLRPQLGGSYTDIHEVIPRLVLGAGLANSAAHWTALAIDLNNAACADFLAVNSGSPSDLLAGFPIFDHTWLLAVACIRRSLGTVTAVRSTARRRADDGGATSAAGSGARVGEVRRERAAGEVDRL